MDISIFGTHVLNDVVRSLEEPSTFLRDLYFRRVQTSDSEDIHFDIEKNARRITPFVHPTQAGKVVQNQGYQTKTFKPAYAKDKRRFDPKKPLSRMMGEAIGGSMTAMQRREAALTLALEDQLEMLARREEAMGSEALRLGQVTVTGENYPTVVVDFQRDAALTITLAGAARWGQSGVEPLDNLEDWADLVHQKSGATANVVTMDPLAARLFKSNAKVQTFLDTRRGSQSVLELAPRLAGQANMKARFLGTMGDLEFWSYQERYLDENGVEQKMMPDNTVILGDPMEAMGAKAYGVIQDEEASYESDRFFAKSWLEKDPALRWLLLQAAPLAVMLRPNATLSATVN